MEDLAAAPDPRARALGLDVEPSIAWDHAHRLVLGQHDCSRALRQVEVVAVERVLRVKPAPHHAAAVPDAAASGRPRAAEVGVRAGGPEVDGDVRPAERPARAHPLRDLPHDLVGRRRERHLDRAEHPPAEVEVGSELRAPVGDLRPLRVVVELLERLVQRVRVDERAAADPRAGQDEHVLQEREPLDPAAAEAGQPEVAAQVPVCPREVLRPEPLPRLEHADAVALLRGPQRRDAPAEPAADDEQVEAGHAHPLQAANATRLRRERELRRAGRRAWPAASGPGRQDPRRGWRR